MSKIDRYIRNTPKIFKAHSNPIIRALFEAWASEDDDIVQQLKNTNSQLFVRRAEGAYLDRLASGLGVARPTELGLFDEDFQELIPNLSLKAKQVRKIFYDTMDVAWGPLFSRTNITSNNVAPFNVSPGDVFSIKIDGEETSQDIKAQVDDIAIPGAATAEEMVAIFSRIKGATPSIIVEPLTGNESINIRTDSPGPRGTVEVLDSTMVSPSKIDFDLRRVRITDLNQRTVLYQLRNRELIIELPAVVPVLRRTLKGSHHFHQDASLEAPVPPENGVWQGSFFFSPLGVPFTVTSKVATLQQTISAGSVVTTLNVTGAEEIDNSPGYLVFDWGNGQEEQPVKYIGRPNNNTLLINPGHVFAKNHFAGEQINVLIPELKPYVPRTSGDDYAIYFTSPSAAREIVQTLLRSLVAAGVVVNFVILLPDYKYVWTNPYETQT